MTTFNYSSGDPSDLTGGAPASMSDIAGPFADLVTFLNGNVSDVNVAAGGIDNDNLDPTTVAAPLGLNRTGSVRRGKSIIATEESRTNVAYGTLTTPDRVSSVVLPTDGLLIIGFDCTLKSSVSSAGSVAIFIGANQLKRDQGSTAPAAQDASSVGTDSYRHVTSCVDGLRVGTGSGWTGNVTTGQLIGSASGAGVMHVFAAAGTYDITAQYLAASGSVTAKDRKLWVYSIGF